MSALACGGGESTTAPPAPPVVATVEILSTSAELVAGASQDLSATVRDNRGAVITGQTIQWASAAPVIATVSNAGRVQGVTLGRAWIIASAGGKADSVQITVRAGTTIEPGRAVTATIGRDGGSLTATSSAGVDYRLEVPPLALMEPVVITMTPIGAMAGMPLSGGVAGAVELKPSGLEFARGAVLRIQASSTAPVGTRLVGFTSTSGEGFGLAYAQPDESGIAVLVSHFSTVGGGFGTTQDLQQIQAFSPNAISLDAIWTQLLAMPLPWNPAVQGMTGQQLVLDAYTNIVFPGLSGVDTDVELLGWLGDYEVWRSMVDYVHTGITGNPTIAPLPGDDRPLHAAPVAFAPQINTLETTVTALIKFAITGNNDDCATQQSFTAMRNVLFWQRQAWSLRIDTPANQLDRATVLANLCVQVVLKSDTLPNLLTVGTDYTLSVVFGARFRGQTVTQATAAPFAVNLVPAGISATPPSGQSTQSGLYQTVVRPQAAGLATLSWGACLVLNDPLTSDVCAQGTITRNAQDPTSNPPPPTPPPPPVGSLTGVWQVEVGAHSTCLAFEGTATVSGSVGGAVSATLTLRGHSGPRGQVCTMGPSNTATGVLTATPTPNPVPVWNATWDLTEFNGQPWDGVDPTTGILQFNRCSANVDANDGLWWQEMSTQASTGTGGWNLVWFRRSTGVPLTQPCP